MERHGRTGANSPLFDRNRIRRSTAGRNLSCEPAPQETAADRWPDILKESGEQALVDSNRLSVAILGTPEHEGRMCGGAFGILGVEPTYVDIQKPTFWSSWLPDVVLLSREWSVDIRQSAIHARRQGIPVIYIMDGVIEWAYLWQNWGFVKPEGTALQPLIASDLCVIGQHAARLLAPLGLADRIHVVGLPRLDGVKRERIIGQDRTPRIVIATAKTFGHNTAHKVYVRAALRDLKNWFDHRSDLMPVWRINDELAAELDVTPSMGTPILDVLQGASGVVAFTSTVLLEAMILGIPTVQIDYRAVPQYFQVAWEIRCAEHIDGVIQEILFPPPEKLAFQAACLGDELESGNASVRLAEVIRQAAHKNPSETMSQTVPAPVSGQVDFRQIHSHLSAFAVSPMSRLQYELDATYQLWERDRDRIARAEDKAAFFRKEIREACQDRILAAIRKLSWMPGLKKTGRALRRLLALE